MIICFIGTRAQLIKMAPIILELERRKIGLHLVLTGQHHETMSQLFGDFCISTKAVHLYQGREITGLFQMGIWFIRCLWISLYKANQYLPRSAGKNDVLLVHGDTMSTLLGAIVGRLRGIRVAHVEAGLRSRNIFHPFPEELTRLAVSRLSELAFCPGEWAYGNLDDRRTKRVNTRDNTLIDALALALNMPVANQSERVNMPEGDFGIASIHRFENIFNKQHLTKIIGMIEQAAEHYPIVFVLHPSTRKKMTHFDLLGRLEHNPKIRISARMGYLDFVRLMRKSKFVLTDGGGNQEELSYLGIPTLIMRKATERQEGLGINATLCNFEDQTLAAFLTGLSVDRNPQQVTHASPSKIIVDNLSDFQ